MQNTLIIKPTAQESSIMQILRTAREAIGGFWSLWVASRGLGTSRPGATGGARESQPTVVRHLHPIMT